MDGRALCNLGAQLTTILERILVAFFLHQDKKLHYDLVAGILPTDTVFLHGNLASNRWWEPTRDLLKAKYHQGEQTGAAAFVEWLGCGQSGAPKSEADLEIKSLAHDVVSLIRGSGLSDVNLVGHSTGGLIALCAALEAPEIFRRIVLLDSVAASGIQFGPEMYEAFTRMSQDRSFCDQIMASTILNCQVNDPYIQNLFSDAFAVNKMIWHGIPNVLKRTDIRAELKNIRLPVLVLHGEKDTLLPIAGSQELAKLLPHADFEVINAQGHCCNVENPQKFTDLVCDFLFD